MASRSEHLEIVFDFPICSRSQYRKVVIEPCKPEFWGLGLEFVNRLRNLLFLFLVDLQMVIFYRLLENIQQ